MLTWWATWPAFGQSWGNSAPVYDGDESAGNAAIKDPRVCRASAGGFHFAYRVHGGNYGGLHITYRRWNGALGAKTFVVHGPQYMWGQEIGESLGGQIHVVWENFGDPLDIGWSYSNNGGASFSPYQIISSSSDSAKVPGITSRGMAGNEMIMAYLHTASNKWYFNRWNGNAWVGQAEVASCDSVYYASGIDRSPADGSVWKSCGYGVNGVISPVMHRYDGVNWSPGIVVSSTGFFARQSIAVNQSGQVMYVWEQDGGVFSRLYTPNNGWGAIQQPGNGHGKVTWIPGTNNFYLAYTADLSRVEGRRWTGYNWTSVELVSVGQPGSYTDNCAVAAANDGSLAAVWEYWGGGNAAGWYSIKPAPPAIPSGTMTGVVRDQHNQGVLGAVVAGGGDVTVSGAGGIYSLAIPAGTHTVSANKNFYAGQQFAGVNIVAGQSTTRDFTIVAEPPGLVSSFAVTPGNTLNRLTWNNPFSGQFTGTMIRYSTSASPTSPQDGQLLLDQTAAPGTSRSFTHTGLTNGVAVYYAAFAYYQDASRHYSTSVVAQNTPYGPADFDRDGDVDQSDYGFFQACYSGPSVPQHNPACAQARLDGDEDVDLNDFGIFQGCISGAGVAANPNCAG